MFTYAAMSEMSKCFLWHYYKYYPFNFTFKTKNVLLIFQTNLDQHLLRGTFTYLSNIFTPNVVSKHISTHIVLGLFSKACLTLYQIVFSEWYSLLILLPTACGKKSLIAQIPLANVLWWAHSWGPCLTYCVLRPPVIYQAVAIAWMAC